MEEQVVVIFAGTNGFIDDYPVAALTRYEKEMLSFLKSRKKDVLEEIRTTGKLEGESEKKLRDALSEFAKQFSVDSKGA
jgi:F-type H+-transporting ATPase subunit alpha